MEGNIATFQFFKLAYGNGTTCDGLIGVTEDVKARLERSKTTYFSTMDGLPRNWNEPMSNVVDMFSRTYCFHGQDLIYSSGRAVLPTPIRP